ncbi:hypothetical protein [Paracidovorax avenae]|uniref:hypothetical protein n=1 Tax=Paracidovorax avenae TaxID=80867 RepID=UPI000FE1CF85|nr:hypothetical protein [Paracidovorax avenae]
MAVDMGGNLQKIHNILGVVAAAIIGLVTAFLVLVAWSLWSEGAVPCGIAPYRLWMEQSCAVSILQSSIASRFALGLAIAICTLLFVCFAMKKRSRTWCCSLFALAAVVLSLLYILPSREGIDFLWMRIAALLMWGILAVSAWDPELLRSMRARGIKWTGLFFIILLPIALIAQGSISQDREFEAKFLSWYKPNDSRHVYGNAASSRTLVVFVEPNCGWSRGMIKQANEISHSADLRVVLQPFSINNDKRLISRLASMEDLPEDQYWKAFEELGKVASDTPLLVNELESFANHPASNVIGVTVTPFMILYEKGQAHVVRQRGKISAYLR